MGRARKLVRRLSDYRTGNITLYYECEDFKYKLTVTHGSKLVTLRRKCRHEKNKPVEYYHLEIFNVYRTYGGRFADGTFSPSPGTEFFMAMFDPCVGALISDNGNMSLKRVMDAGSHMDAIIESWSQDGGVAPLRFCKYHLKFRLNSGPEDDDDDELSEQ